MHGPERTYMAWCCFTSTELAMADLHYLLSMTASTIVAASGAAQHGTAISLTHLVGSGARPDA
jgi:hypothetical protein